MNKLFNAEEESWIRENCAGIRIAETARRFSVRFGREITYDQMKAYMARHRLTNGLSHGQEKGQPSKVFPKEVFDYMMHRSGQLYTKELTKEVNEKFGTNYNERQIKAWKSNHGVHSKDSHRYKKGNVPWTKGLKGLHFAGSEKGQFKKGQIPHNAVPVGTKIKDTYGYWKIKTGEPDIWEFMHIAVWTTEHGEIPEGHAIAFLDGDKDNYGIDNLACVPKGAVSVMNAKYKKRPAQSRDEYKARLTIARITVAAKRRGGEKREDTEQDRV